MSMKKTLIAAGVAAAMAVPMVATADVSLTARLQAELTSVSGDTAEGLQIGDGMQNRNANVNSGNWSRVDLRGSHDLGNGLTAIGHISMNLNPSSFPSGTRESNVGLQGDFGRIRVGRMTNAAATNGKDPFNGTFMQARGNGGMMSSGEFTGLGGAAIADGGYLNQAIGYDGTFGPVSLGATVGLDPDRDEGNHAYAILVDVDVNPVNVWVGFASADDFNENAVTDPDTVPPTVVGERDRRVSKIGASFTTGPFSVMAQYEAVEGSNRITAGTGDPDINYMMVAGTYKMGANTFMLGYGQGDADDSDGDKNWIALGARHAFSRQVSVHGGVRQTNHADDDQKETVFGAGMRVVF